MNTPKEVQEAVKVLNTSGQEDELTEAGIVVVNFALTLQDKDEFNALLLSVNSSRLSKYVICPYTPLSDELAKKYNAINPSTNRKVNSLYQRGAPTVNPE